MLGKAVGSSIADAVGYYSRLDPLEPNRLFHVSLMQLRWADECFERYRNWTVFFSRMLPLLRTFISLPAGVAKMPFGRFLALTTLGSIPWVLAPALIGEDVDNDWEGWCHHLTVLDNAIAVGIVYLIIKRRRGGSSGEGESGTTDQPNGL